MLFSVVSRYAPRLTVSCIVGLALATVYVLFVCEHITAAGHRPIWTEDIWFFDYSRDARHYGLSEQQCELAFPNLGHEIDRAVATRKGNPITFAEVNIDWRDHGIIRALLYDDQLFIIDQRDAYTNPQHRSRSIAVLQSIYRAITAFPGSLPNIEFTVTLEDEAVLVFDHRVTNTTWAFTRQEHSEHLWLIPDFGFWGWEDVRIPSYAFLSSSIARNDEDEFQKKIPRLAWRGSVEVDPRGFRKSLVNVSAGQTWSDVQTIDWKNKTDLESKWISMEDHCKYMFLAQTEGNSWSGRMKYLLNCRSVLMSHKLEWKEFYHHLLVPSGPDQNYVELALDFSDLPERMDYYLKNLNEAERIAENSVQTFRRRYLSPAAEACYWRRLIHGWAEVQGFEPELYEEEHLQNNSGQAKKINGLRGKPFEGFSLSESFDTALPAPARKLCQKAA